MAEVTRGRGGSGAEMSEFRANCAHEHSFSFI